MIVSYKWLQTYFKEKLPAPAKVAEAFTFGAFEVEVVEEVHGKNGADGNDTTIDLKVLPDRACYALSHRGIAYELSAITGQSSLVFENKIVGEIENEKADSEEKVSVTVIEPSLCQRYCARFIKNVSVGASPEWLQERLTAVGQRSINNIVDVTNFVMLDIGQPLHAFDADKVKGGIVVRLAKEGEVVELLPEKGSTVSRSITLQSFDLIIADDEGPIAIAGVKGGIRTAVTATTRNLIIESANFDAVSVRKTSTRLALRNDASKRFENRLSVDFAEQAMKEVSTLIKKVSTKASLGEITDVFSGQTKQTKISVSKDFISARLGGEFSTEQIEDIFSRLQIAFEKKGNGYTLTIPSARLDLNIPEDMVEEVGRIYGYNKITPKIPEKISGAIPVNHVAYWTEKIKDSLFENGFSEVQTSSFAVSGDIEIQNPLASDKKFLRNNLSENLLLALEQNSKNAPLFGTDEIKIFEVGTVFSSKGEYVALGIGANITKNIKKKEQMTAEMVNKAFQTLSEVVGKKLEMPKIKNGTGAVAEINLSEIISNLSTPTKWDINKFSGSSKYVPFSAYPFMVRDVAVFVPGNVSEKEVSSVISSATSSLMIRLDLFDVFTKKFEGGEDKTSYAFHIVFQSYERTLREEEINTIMKNVSDALAAKSWQVR